MNRTIIKKSFLGLFFLGVLFEGWLVFWLGSLPSPLSQRLFYWVGINIGAGLLLEAGFRLGYRIVMGRPYKFVPKVPFKRMFVEPHPYLPFVTKKDFSTPKPMATQYPLNKNKGYYFDRLISNNFGHCDGPQGNRKFVLPKPAGQIRILCLGASTTGNYIWWDGQVFSYPMELEKYLKDKFPGNDIVVYNCGQGGWTSAEILINFVLRLYDLQPDMIVFYHAYNDLSLSLTPGFEADFTHARKNLGEAYFLYRLASFIPDIPLAIYNAALKVLFPYMNPIFGVIEAVSQGKPDLSAAFQGTVTYRRNLEHLIKICRESRIDIVLSSFAYYLYEQIKDSKIHLKYREGVLEENRQMQELASLYGLPLVDHFHLVPQEEQYFVDSIHFSPEGMRLVAENFGQALSPLIAKKISSGKTPDFRKAEVIHHAGS